jgi:hypothetical protein
MASGFVSCFNSSHASQKRMFSSLYSQRRKSRNILRPPGFCKKLEDNRLVLDCSQTEKSLDVNVYNKIIDFTGKVSFLKINHKIIKETMIDNKESN